jgi:peptide/nickel transport system substrate-binding protein
MLALAAAAAALSLVAACGGNGSTAASGSSASYNAAVTGVVNPSTKTGGTLNYALSSTPDSTDPGNTYYSFMWNFARLYTRQLVTFKPAPGNAGLQLVPDLATGLGTVSPDGLTWTYHIQPNVKFEDGTTVTTQDIKYAIERSTNYAPSVLPNGPTYFQQVLTDPTYPGAYKDTTPNKMGLTAIGTPDSTTIVFHLQHPFADFNYLVANPQTSPVPPAKDTGANYQSHPMSTGPYMFSQFNPNTGFALVKNPNWSASTDPNRKQLANQINVAYNVNAADIDNRLMGSNGSNGSINIDMSGTGVQAAARASILGNPNLKKNADNSQAGFLRYAALNTQVAPLNNVHCRKAVMYAVDHVALQTAYGGPVAGGDIATTVLPPSVLGYQKADMYNFAANPHGDLAAAKNELQLCGQPNGFTTNISARSDRPTEVAAATSIQASLASIGIKAGIQQYPSGQYFTNFAGSPNFAKQHNLGIMLMAWGADWPTGFGFLSQIADGRAIKAAGNSNLSAENNPQINTLLDKSTTTTDPNARNQIYAQIDQALMSDAVILPMVDAKALLYRNPANSNVYVTQAYGGEYDYTQIGPTH